MQCSCGFRSRLNDGFARKHGSARASVISRVFPMLFAPNCRAIHRDRVAGGAARGGRMSPASSMALAAGPPALTSITMRPTGWTHQDAVLPAKRTGWSETPSQPRSTLPSRAATRVILLNGRRDHRVSRRAPRGDAENRPSRREPVRLSSARPARIIMRWSIVPPARLRETPETERTLVSRAETPIAPMPKRNR